MQPWTVGSRLLSESRSAITVAAVLVTVVGVSAALTPTSVLPIASHVVGWLYLGAPIIAAFTCRSAARRSSGGYRRFWHLLALSMAIWPVGQLLFLLLNPFGLYSFPSWVEIPLVVSNALTMAALLSYPRDGALPLARRLLDGSMTAIAVMLVVWHLWLDPLLDFQEGHSQLASVAGLYFPIVSAMQLTIGLIIWNHATPGHRLPLGMVTLGFAFLACGGIWYAQMRSAGELAMAGFAWNMIGNLCTALAPLLAGPTSSPVTRSVAGPRAVGLAPYVPTVVALAMSVHYFVTGTASVVDLIAVFALVSLVLARQYLTLRHNAHLTRAVELSEQIMRHQALHDRLTGLANRTLFHDRLQTAINGDDPPVAVLFIDLDDFKVVNDTLGHRLGDGLLVAFSERLRAEVRQSDTVARLGGDEFAVLLDCTVNDPTRLAHRIVQRMDAPFDLDGESVTVHTSIGVARVSGEEPMTVDQVLARADTAMIRAKREGKGRVVEYHLGMTLVEADDQRLRQALVSAIADGTFTVALQPIIDLATGEHIGDEALLRLDHDSAYANPLLVLTAATRGGMLPALTSAVVERACCRRLDQVPASDRSSDLHINVQPSEIGTAELFTTLDTAFASGHIQPHQLVLEVAETAPVEDSQAFSEGVAALRDRGVRIALDDFGTGPSSSLGRLGELDVDIIKIAPALIDQVDRLPRSLIVLESILYMAGRLDITVIAKGVERVTQLDELRRIGFPLGQGYLLGSPDIGAATELLNPSV